MNLAAIGTSASKNYQQGVVSVVRFLRMHHALMRQKETEGTYLTIQVLYSRNSKRSESLIDDGFHRLII